MCNGGDSTLIFSYLLIIKAMCVAYNFACDVRVMNDVATKQRFLTVVKIFFVTNDFISNLLAESP